MTSKPTTISYSLLNAIGYTKAVGERPRLARAETDKALIQLTKGRLGESTARRSRLYKAVEHLRSLGYRPIPALSTIKEVVMKSAEGMEAIANNKGQALVKGKEVRRFLNG